jgi:hypothetical protein
LIAGESGPVGSGVVDPGLADPGLAVHGRPCHGCATDRSSFQVAALGELVGKPMAHGYTEGR